MTTHSPLHTSRISDALLRTIYASDQEMYPAPLTYERLQSWRDACPDLSICFSASDDDSAEPVGVIIVLPLLKKYWEDLLLGKIKEVDVDAEEMFVRGELQAPAEVGLHVFHIERFAAWDAADALDALKKTGARPAAVTVRGCQDSDSKMGFADIALEEIQRRVEAANAEAGNNRRRWDVLGFSALTATPAGKKTFARLGFVPTGYKEIFHLVKKSSSSSLVPAVRSDRDRTGSEQNTAVTQTIVKPVYIFPGETYTPGLYLSDVMSESEMTVRYSCSSAVQRNPLGCNARLLHLAREQGNVPG